LVVRHKKLGKKFWETEEIGYLSFLKTGLYTGPS
jgi:hypothetical protein